MSRRGAWARYESFRGGQRSDLPAHLIPDDSMLLAENVITNKIGRAAKRGPVQPYLSTGVSANIEHVGVTKVTIGSAIPQGVGVSAYDQAWYAFTLPTSTTPRVGSLSTAQSFNLTNRVINLTTAASPAFGPSFNSFGLTGFPLSSSDANVTSPFIFFSTAKDSTAALTTTGVCTLDAGKNTIGVPASVTAINPIGSFIYISNYPGTGPTANEYIGYVTAVGTSTVDVYPAPTTSFTSTATGIIQVSPYQSIVRNSASPTGNTTLCESGGGIIPQSSSFACVHQNRVVLCTQAENTVNATGTINEYTKTRGNVVSWSSITGESATAANTGADGILSMLPAGWPKSQRLTLDTAKVVALVSMDANNLMVLCIDKVLMISGTLGTVVPAAGVNTSSFSVRTIAADVGCIDEDSIQRTPYGVVFASRNGVYLTDGTTFTNIMVDKIQNEWNVYQYDQSNSVCGSAVLGDTHYVLFTVKGPHFICDMPNDFAWTKMSVNPDIDGNVTIALDAKSQATYTLGASSSYIPSARYYGGSAGTGLDYGMLVSSVSLGGDLWVQKTVSSGAAMTQITGVTTDTTTDRRDIGVANNATRVVIPTVSGGTCSIRVYTISGSVATLEQSLSAPATKTFSTSMNVDMSAAGDIVVAKLTDGFAIYERSGTTWSLATSFVLASATATISGDGSTIAVSSGATIYLYTKTGGVWSLSTSFGYAAPNLTSFNLGGNNLSIAYDATWVAGIGVYGTTTKFAVWRKTGVNSWSAAGLVSLATLSVYRYDSIGINVNGYVALNRYLASGFTANNSDAMLYKYDSLSNSYVLSRSGFSTGKSGIGGASIGWDSSGSNLNIWRNTGNLTMNTSTSTFSYTRSTYQSYGIGIRDWSGSSEVYAPRYGGPTLSSRSDAVVLLDSILETDDQIVTTASGFNQLLDAGTSTAYNATIETKAYSFGDTSVLKSFKTLMFTYDADAKNGATDPVSVWSAEGLEPVFNFSLAPKYTADATPSATPSVPSTETTRYSIYPRAIDAGIGFAFKTNFVVADSATGLGRFQLYDVGINAVELRKGRIVQ